MEHKLLLGGGEQYLPFARSRIKAMRAAGLKYATQKYVFQDGEVEVRIVGDQRFIRISGGSYDVLSGVVQGGSIIAGDPDVLRDFKPTVQCWSYPLKKREGTSTTAFHDEPILAIDAHANAGVSGSQYTDLCSSMYSGLMAKAVQVILGIGKQKPTDDGVQVKYDYRWARCHGIAKGADGKSWLIEISQAEGVLAMLLPLIKGTSGFAGNPQKVLSETVKLFKGIPSGDTFPTGAALTAAITAGTVLRLKTASDMNVAFGKTAFTPTLGWSFNDIGTEAHNTCYTNVAGVQTSYHYRLDVTIGAVIKDRAPETPIAAASASITEVGSGPLYGPARFKFHNSTANSNSFYSTTAWPGGAEQTAPIFVCHIDGTLEVVRHYSAGPSVSTTATNSGVLPVTGVPPSLTDATYGPDDPLRPGAYTTTMGPDDPINFQWQETTVLTGGASCVRSDRYPDSIAGGTKLRIDQTGSLWFTHTYLGTVYLFPYNERTKVERLVRPACGMMLRGTRDGYAYREAAEARNTVTTTCYAYGWFGPPSPEYYGMALTPVGSPATSYTRTVFRSATFFDIPYPTVPLPVTQIYYDSGPWIDEIKIVTSSEVSSITLTHANLAASDLANQSWTTTVGICDARSSALGEGANYLYSGPVGVSSFNANLRGPMFTGVTSPSSVKYSFVGYT